MTTKENSRPGPKMMLRFGDGSELKDKLEAVAKANGRTLTGEILGRLEASLAADPQGRMVVVPKRTKPANALEKRLALLEALVSKLDPDDGASLVPDFTETD